MGRLLGSKDTPANIVAALNGAITSIVEDQAAAENLKKSGELIGFTPQQAAEFIKGEVTTWGERVKTAGAQVE